MKSTRRFTLLTCMIMLVLLTLVGCGKGDSVTSVALLDHPSDAVIEIALGDFDCNAYTVVVTYESGKTEKLPLTEDMILETDLFKLYQIGEHDITFNYGDSQCTFKVSVKRNSFGNLAFPENNVFTYNGKAHTLEVDGEIPANAVVTYIGGNSFVNVGTYDVTAVVSCEGYVTQTLTATVKIERAKYDMSGVKFESKEVVYDGSYHSVAISGRLPDGVSSPTYTINGKAGSSAINAGEYTVKATFANNDPNYEAIPEMETTLKIIPAEYTVKGVDIVFKSEDGNVISGATKIYDGKSITFDLNDYSKLSKKLIVSFTVYDKDGKVISTSNKKTNILNVGVYTARVEFTMADGNNYKPIPSIERAFEVLKAEYPSLQNIQFSASQTQYDGNAHSIAIEGQLPAGVTVLYEYYKDGKLLVDGENKPVQSVVDAGRYTVKAIFTHTDANRGEIAPLSSVLNITAMNFNVSNLSVELNGSDVYDGTEKSVNLIGQLPSEIKASLIYYQNGSAVENGDGSYVSSVIEPGEYYVSVRFVSTSNNYVISGMLEYEFTIKKAIINPNNVERDGDSEYIYNGNNQIPSIKDGTVPDHVNVTEQLFSIDANGNRTAASSAINVGNYVKVVTVALDDPTRYQLSNSGVIEWAFEITPQPIDVSGINIGTENITYNGSDLTPALKGVPALVDYDLTLYTIDGTEPITEAINAGKYRIEAILTPKNSNYVLSSDEKLVFDFEILPIEIDVSGLEFDNLNFTYDGQKHYPALTDIPAHVLVTTHLHWTDNENNNSEEYEGKRLAVDVGTYGCKITLRAESSNYVLLGTTTYTASFEIGKTPIDISERLIDDFKLIYTEDRYNEDIIKAVLLDGIDAYVECLPGAYYFETAENQWQYKPTMIESGRYKITVRFKIKDSNNYSLVYDGIELLEKSVDVYFTVEVVKLVGQSSYTYDGQPHQWTVNNLPDTVQLAQSLYLVDAEGNRIPVDSAVDCGNYVMALEFILADGAEQQFDANLLTTLEKEFSIIPSEIDVSEITLNASSVTYDGNNLYPSLKNIPEHVLTSLAVYPYEGTEPIEQLIDAGKYRVKVVLSTDSSNYVPSNEELVFDFEILPLEIDVSSLELKNSTVTYTAGQHYPTLNTVPAHVFAMLTLYTLDGTEPIVNAVDTGKYRVEVVLSADSPNYVPSDEELVFDFEILPIEIDVSGLEFDNLNFTYDGQKHYPALTDIPAHVLVTTYLHWADNENNNSEEYEGKRLAVDIGTYGCKITLRAESSNYVLLGTTTYTASFEIDKTPIDISERFIDDVELAYTAEGYNEDALKAVLLDGIDAYVECLPGAYYFETAENRWQYTPTMIESGRYKITVRFKIKDSNNYSLVYDGIELLEKIVDVYFMVV